MMARATSTSTKPATKVEMVWECMTPMGPRMSSVPPSARFMVSLRKEKWSPFSSTPRYTLVTMVLMISPKARVTMAR